MARAAPAGVALAVFAALFAYTWRCWTDVTVDFGRELYVAWRIASGEVLYRDIAWPSGPLSAYVGGLVFRLFGPSLTALALWNTALAAVTFALVFALVARHAGRWNAALTTSAAAVVFGFGQHGGIGNYNHVTPYSHEVVHGVLAGALALFVMLRASHRAHAGLAACSGLLSLAAFATKAEPFVATLVGVGIAVLLAPAGVRARLALFACGAFAAGFVAVWALLAREMPWRDALRGLSGPWPYLAASGVTEAHFYERLAGLDRPAAELRTTLRWSAGWLAVLVVPLLVLRAPGPRWPARTASRRVLGVVVAGAGLALGLAVVDRGDVLDLGRPTALATATVLTALVFRAWRSEGPLSKPHAERIAWASFALALLPKLGLKQTWIFYGFVHALPAFAVLAAALLRVAQRARGVPGGGGPSPGACWVVGVLAAVVVVHLRSMSVWLGYKVNEVGRGGDRILADGRGDEVADALEWIGENASPEATVLVLPEGLSLNYWSRRRTPLRFLGFMPTELQLFGEDALVAALQRTPPDFVLLVHKDTSDYGVRFFGHDYGHALAAWIGARYEPAALFGSPPFNGVGFGIVALRPR